MPRLPPSLFWRARQAAPLSTLLLPVCRDLPSSLAELRWIRQHVVERGSKDPRTHEAQIFRLCRRRGRGEPLQYVLGTQPFGPLDLLCRPGVLIPRPEPESYSICLADVLAREAQQAPAPPTTLTILDACTGTGCIALLLCARLCQALARTRAAQTQVRVVGVDIAPEAVQLARDNRARNKHLWGGQQQQKEDAARTTLSSSSSSSSSTRSTRSTVHFYQADLFADDWLPRVVGTDSSSHPQERASLLPLDVLVSNPPYVSADGFAHDTARSVRQFEPKLAQVPSSAAVLPKALPEVLPEDIFYGRLLALAERFDTRILLCEVGGLEQAERVVAMALSALARAREAVLDIEIWADCPDLADGDGPRAIHVAGREVPIRGSGHGRSVFIRRR